MKRRTKIISICVVVALLAAPLIYWALQDGKKLVAKTRAELQMAGFKTELDEFDFSTSLEDQMRMAPLTNLGSARVPEDWFAREARERSRRFFPELMPIVGRDAAMVIWRQEKLPASPEQARTLPGGRGGPRNYVPNGRPFLPGSEPVLAEDVWPALRSLHQVERLATTIAAQAALSGPIRFHLEAKQGSGMLLPHLAALKNHQSAFGRAMVVELREGNKEAAWTNLLAASRLITAWEPELAEISTLVRFACLKIAFQTLWQGLRAGWSEEHLASLQREWETVDFMKELPATVSFTRACAVATIRADREQRLQQPVPLPQLMTTPRQAWSNFRFYQEQLSYQRYGTYEEEAEAMLFYRDREAEMRRAIQAGSWMEMRDLPVVTNTVFRSPHSSAYRTLSSMRQVMMASMDRPPGGGQTLLGKAADAEARRRIIVTAIALERYRARHGAYPETLGKLAPDFVAEEPLDYTDGQPLRYRLGADGSYLLYSGGMDCVDDGGVARESVQGGISGGRFPGMAERIVERDLVWPRMASEAEVAAFRKEQEAANARREMQRAEAAAEWERRREIGEEFPETFE